MKTVNSENLTIEITAIDKLGFPDLFRSNMLW